LKVSKIWIDPLRYHRWRWLPIILLAICCCLLAGCSQPPRFFLVMARVTASDGQLIALGSEQVSNNPSQGQGWHTQYHYFTSTNLGKTWEEVSTATVAFDALPEEPHFASNSIARLEKTLCLPPDKKKCYRINGKALIEESTDGGTSWKIAWAAPVARQHFMERFIEDGITVDLTPYDLTVVEHNGQMAAVVALGNQGLLVSHGEGQWNAIPIQLEKCLLSTYDQCPVPPSVPVSVQNWEDLLTALRPEFYVFFPAMIPFFGLQLLFGWKALQRKKKNPLAWLLVWQVWWSFLPAIASYQLDVSWISGMILVWGGVAAMMVVFAVVLPLITPGPEAGTGFSYIMAHGVFFLLIVPAVYFFFGGNFYLLGILLIFWYLSIAARAGRGKLDWLMITKSLGYTLLFGFCLLLPYLLWAVNLFPRYEMALVLSALAGVFTTLAAWRLEKKGDLAEIGP